MSEQPQDSAADEETGQATEPGTPTQDNPPQDNTAPRGEVSPEEELRAAEANERAVEEDSHVQKVLEDASDTSPWQADDDAPAGREG